MNNYLNWRNKIQKFLIVKSVWTVTDAWTDKEEKAHTYIALIIGDDQIQHIRNCKSAEEAWEKLKNFHEKDTPNSWIAILRKFMTKKLEEGGDVVAHVNGMKNC